VFDVDGTLIDTNYHHAMAWHRALRRYDITCPLWRIHRAVGMGGDRLVAAVAGEEIERTHGDDLRAAWSEEYDPFLGEVQPFTGARELLAEVRKRGFRLVLASSGPKPHVEHYLDLLDARDLTDAWTTAEDVESTKPAPDLVGVAVDRAQGRNAVLVGDSTWDAVAAGHLDVPTIAVRTGGFSVDELRGAGAVAVYDSLGELYADLDNTLLREAASG
jgi:HAD superfamily hydrolase (TIGR01549 family)